MPEHASNGYRSLSAIPPSNPSSPLILHRLLYARRTRVSLRSPLWKRSSSVVLGVRSARFAAPRVVLRSGTLGKRFFPATYLPRMRITIRRHPRGSETRHVKDHSRRKSMGRVSLEWNTDYNDLRVREDNKNAGIADFVSPASNVHEESHSYGLV